MAIPSRPKRGLQDIKTHAGKVKQAVVPYKAFMRLSCLEMEKFRRERERESAMVRVRNIDARFKEIELEKAEILDAVGSMASTGPDTGEEPAKKAPPTQSGTGPFRFKY